MPTSRQGTAAFYPPSRLALPWGARVFEETPHASGLAAGSFFSGAPANGNAASCLGRGIRDGDISRMRGSRPLTPWQPSQKVGGGREAILTLWFKQTKIDGL